MRSSRSLSGVRIVIRPPAPRASRLRWSVIWTSSTPCRAISCARSAPPRSPASACLPKPRRKAVPRAVRRGTEGFGPRSLSRRLAQLLPGFPDVAVCVAFSGGADSTALLAALAQLERPPLKLRALHVDHRLHPHSVRWVAHCRRVARALGVPLQVRTAKVARLRGESPEAAARAARYQLLAAALAPQEALLTAHHEDDQLETVLLQLLRGAGLAGMAAMPARAAFARGALVRPLLSWSRAELTAWVRSRGLEWLEDPGNAELRHDRNYLRMRVLPLIRERWPAAAATVARAARHAAAAPGGSTVAAHRLRGRTRRIGRRTARERALAARRGAAAGCGGALRASQLAVAQAQDLHAARAARSAHAETRCARTAGCGGTPRHAHHPRTPGR